MAREDASFGILHALYWFAAELATDAPVLIVVDDAHWADAMSLRFAHYLQRRLEGVPLSLLLAARVGDPVPDLRLLDLLRAEPSVRLVTLRALGREAVAAVADRMYGAPVGRGFAAACHRVTAGNPYYLRELLRALVVDGVAPTEDEAARVEQVTPRALEASVLRRVAAVGGDAPGVATVMSALGDGASLRHVACLAGVDAARAAAIARSLRTADVLAQEDPVQFMHPIVRRVVWAQLTVTERDVLHAAAARMLLDEGPASDRVAAHLLLTVPARRSWVVEALRVAGRHAVATSAVDTAIACLQRALAEPPDESVEAAVLAELGAAEALASDRLALDHLRAAIDRTADPVRRAELGLQLADVLQSLFRNVEACDVLRAALADAPQAESELRAHLEAALIATALYSGETASEGVRLLGERSGSFPPGVPGRSMRAQLALVLAFAGQPADEVGETARVALEHADARDLWSTWMAGLHQLVVAERFAEAQRLADRCGELPLVARVGRRVSSLEALRGFLKTSLGALGDAVAHLRTSLELLPAPVAPVARLLVLGWLVDALVPRGDLAEAADMLASAPAEPWPAHVGTGYAIAARGRLRLAQGRVDDALEDFHALAELARPWNLAGPGVVPWRADAATALLAAARREEARALILADLARARAYGAPGVLGRNLRVAGLAEGGTRGLELLNEAVGVLAGAPAELERARALVEYGAALRRGNQRTAARGVLDDGLRLAQRCGARPLAERAFDELRASGRRLRRSDLQAPDALTPSEHRVARLAASGMTNRNIARSLYLSPKTVEMHLSRVYRKLGVASRSDLPGALPDSL